MAEIEIEWQFDAVDVRPVERWLLAEHPGPSVVRAADRRFVDTYADTEDWRLHRAGYTLRLRRAGGQVEATLKSMEAATDGMRRRRELTEPLGRGGLEALAAGDGPVGHRVRLICGTHALRAIFVVRTRRRTFDLAIGEQPAGEVALDDTAIPVDSGGEPVRLRRIEVEVTDPEAPGVAAFVESMRSECGLTPASLSKFEAGLLGAGLSPSAGLDLGPEEVEPGQSVGESAFAVLRAQFGALLAKEAGTRLGEDAEELHDMRVATRRLRAAMSLFDGILPVRAARLRDELGWLAGPLGDVRDLDVQLEQLDRWTAQAAPDDRGSLAALRTMLDGQRTAARTRLADALDSGRYERLVAGFTAMLRRGPLRRSPASRAAVVVVAPDLIEARHRKVRKAARRIGKGSGPADYHRLRIRCKRFRYALEFLAPVYEGPARDLIKRLVKVQDLLGLHQDAVVAVGRLRTLATEAGPDGAVLPPSTIFAMGEVAQRYAQQAHDLRRRFLPAYGKLRGKPWRRLRRVMEEARPPQPPVAARPDGAVPATLVAVAPLDTGAADAGSG